MCQHMSKLSMVLYRAVCHLDGRTTQHTHIHLSLCTGVMHRIMCCHMNKLSPVLYARMPIGL